MLKKYYPENNLLEFIPSTSSIRILQDTALAMGKKNKRIFPWRSRMTPYKVFAAEFFLQRTGASQVAKVYPVFISHFPNLNGENHKFSMFYYKILSSTKAKIE